MQEQRGKDDLTARPIARAGHSIRLHGAIPRQETWVAHDRAAHAAGRSNRAALSNDSPIHSAFALAGSSIPIGEVHSQTLVRFRFFRGIWRAFPNGVYWRT